MVETDTPSLMSDTPRRPSSWGLEGPTLARPSDSRMIRFIIPLSRFLRISFAPCDTPPKMAVLPRASTRRIFLIISGRFSADWAGTIVSISWSKITIETISRSSSLPTASMAASRALMILSPLMEPERSSTIARLTDGRSFSPDALPPFMATLTTADSGLPLCSTARSGDMAHVMASVLASAASAEKHVTSATAPARTIPPIPAATEMCCLVFMVESFLFASPT